ncbi:hybrid sensor histidine kinase/response regulator [Wocania ichthyoenteri]|uniref:hybrid sensor histidine kinase/response regulator n=1 Tax=Wocania ichthyoenteri TaxID=1230531 RepID=UPI00053E3AA0|nr:hybrid sensor histidine kinase/response regulator [Wocania ichthyoenteri]
MKYRHSIVFRLALFFTGLIIFSILLSGYLVFKKSSHVIIEYSKKRMVFESELAEQAFYALLGEVSNDIAVIASSPSLQNYVLGDFSKKANKDINQLFSTVLKNKASYFQIRYIGTKNNGEEIIRFDKIDGKILKSNDLQKKGDRDYFKEAIGIKKGEFYFSKINLNEEYGVISLPYTPTLRAASPIFNVSNKIIGIVIINVNLNKFYNILNKISNEESQLYLINSEGEYLYAPEKNKEFASQKNKIYNFYEDFSVDSNTIINSENKSDNSTKILGNGVLSYIKELNYFQEKRKIYLISTIKQNVLLKSAQSVRSDSIQTLLWVCLISILVSWLFVSFISKKINQVTKAISNYDKGLAVNIELPINRNDEIGILARAFDKMKTKIDQNLKKLNTALEKEKQAKQQRDEFLQNMSHEMRTPLNAILGLNQLLRKNTPSDAQLPIIGALERSSNNLAGLVYDVLDHKKLVEGNLNIKYQPTNICQLLKDIHSSYRYEAIQKGLSFNIEIEEQLENETFQTDPLRLSQIITNLVVNAIKFTLNGNITLHAAIVEHNGKFIEIRVTDTGIGILPENINKINNRYFQESDHISGRYGGYGLGLSIVKQLTNLFGGSFKAKTKKGSGSEFYVKLPAIPSTLNKSKNDNSLKEITLPQLEHSYKILHIEDDSSTLELMKHILEDKYIILKQVTKLDDAKEYLAQNSPDIIFSDLLLNETQLKSELKNWIKTKKIDCPLVLISALEPEVMASISPMYFQKPFDIDHLKDFIHKILGANEFSLPDFSNIYSNYDYDNSKIVKVLNLLIDEFETYMTRIDTCIATKNQDEWEAILHKLIAHINNLKLTSLLDVLPNEVKSLKQKNAQKVYNTFAYYLCCFRLEKRINLKD